MNKAKTLAVAIIVLFAGASLSHAGFGALADMAKKKAAEEANKATEEAKKQATEAASKAGMDALKAGAEALYGDEDAEEEEDVQEAPQKQYQPPQQTQRISPRSAQTAQQVYMLPDEGKSAVSFGIRAGLNFSHIYLRDGIYRVDWADILGMQAGFVVDYAVSSWFHIQPSFMYIQKGMSSYRHLFNGKYIEVSERAHYLELPLLLSLKLDILKPNIGPYLGALVCNSDVSGGDNFKLAVLRLNVGPYLGALVVGSDIFGRDIFADLGLSTGIGFDIGMFYIGAFYEYGFFNVRREQRPVPGQVPVPSSDYYNRTLGFNLGINL